MQRIHYLLIALGLTIVFGVLFMFCRDAIFPADTTTKDDIVASSTDNVSVSATNTDQTINLPDSANRVKPRDNMPETPVSDAEQFTGTLTEVNTGCFADGECYAVVDGKHVTLLVGRYQGYVGDLVGVESIGDLAAKIGTRVDVFAAKDKQTGRYTILGNEKFNFVVQTSPNVGDENDYNYTEPRVVVGAGCMIGGCSSQMCGEAGSMDGMASTCEWRQQYECYLDARCEKQADGKCGWTQTDELKMCLAEKI